MIGQTISHYKIIVKLGEGGMGVVYKTEDTKLKRIVALKFLPSSIMASEVEKIRFIHEAQAAAALNHPNICTIHEIDEVEGQSFIAMEFVEGQSMKDKVNSNQLSVNSVIEIAIQIAEGLQAAHEKSITHRDIKPANIMVTPKGQVKIMDFGLAKFAGQERLTKTGMTLGTLAYMSPEQGRGEKVDHRTDIWSLGVVLYEMLTSRLPFLHEYEAAIVYSILNETPTPPTELRDDIPKDLEHIALKCLQKNRNDRYPSAQQLLSDLKKLQKALESGKPEVIIAPKEKPDARKESERRQATVMFASLSGYKEMLEALDPEEVVAVMNRCFTMFAEMAQKYGGVVDKTMGNCVTVLFGVPQAIENAPQKAINAAIEMRNQIQQFNRKNKLPISLDTQIGVNTGMVVAGNVGAEQTKEYTVIGDTVELASDLMASCTNGQIYVGPLTYRYTRDEFDYRELKPITLKGLKTPVPVFELLSVREKIHRPWLGAERMIYSEMVGRDQELDKLKLHVLKVINGEGSIVSVIGEAGIGKSRLIAELRMIDDIKKVTLLEGRALSIGQNLSYHPIIDILKNWTNITEEDTEAEAMAKLEMAIGRVHPEGVAEVFPFIATLMGMKLTGKPAERVRGIEGEAMEKLILKNLRELMAKGAERRPIVCVLNDLHWADMTSIELLKSLYRLSERTPILFINVMRPNYPETGDRILETIRERYPTIHAEMVLGPLNNEQCQNMIRNLLKATGIPENVSREIEMRAEGNPFFIEEVVRSLIDEGALVLQNGKFKVTGKITSVVIPETIQDVLMARIDRLDEETRQLLKNASVIGRYFFYKILNEVAKSIGKLDERLDYLKGVQLILESGRTEELEYLFKHVLAQEVTYESILLKKRKELHLQVAEAIESVFKERLHEFYGMLALHYNKGENLEKAEEYLTKAGEEALRAAASSEALNYYQKALKLYLEKFGDTVDTEKVAMLEKNIALAFFNKGLMAEAVEHFDRVFEYWGEKPKLNKITQAVEFIWTLFNILWYLYLPVKRNRKIPTPRENEVFKLLEKRGLALVAIDTTRMFFDSVGVMRRLNDFDINKTERGVEIFAGGGALFSLTGLSLNLAEKIINSAGKVLDKSTLDKSTYHFYKAVHDFLIGNWNNTEPVKEELIDMYLSLGETNSAGGYLIWRALPDVEQGNFKPAEECVAKLVNIADTYGNDTAIGRQYILKTRLLMRKRELSLALKMADLGSQFIRSRKLNLYALWVFGIKPYIQVLLGDFQGARESIVLANQDAENEKVNLPLYLSGLLMSNFLLHLTELEEFVRFDDTRRMTTSRKLAYFHGRAAVKHAMKYAADRTEAFKLLGVYYWLINKQKKALKWWDKSIRTGEHLGARPELARTYMEVGKRLLEKKSKYRELNGISAEAYLEKARTLFQEMDLQWDLEELEKVERRQ